MPCQVGRRVQAWSDCKQLVKRTGMEPTHLKCCSRPRNLNAMAWCTFHSVRCCTSLQGGGGGGDMSRRSHVLSQACPLNSMLSGPDSRRV